MADWSTPSLSTAYATFLTNLKDRDEDAATLFVSAPSNQPTGAMKYLRASNKFQEWDGAAWQDKVLAIAGGGTGGSTAATARTSLGLGTMATQDSSSVSISGGTLAGSGSGITALNGSNISSGTVAAARLGSGTPDATKFLRGDSSWQVVDVDIQYDPVDKSADFTPSSNTAYNLTGSHTVTLPTVVGIGGHLIILIMKGTGVWVLDPNGSETILGALTYTFDWGQYGVIVLKADSNNGKWDII